ncbi:MAG: MG2 domain-containing protein [Phycisphaeraceae bacterium]
MTRKGMLRLVTGLILVGLIAATSQLAFTAAETAADLLKKADKAFDDKNYRDAAQAYTALLKADPKSEKWEHASKRIVQSQLRLQLFDDALESAEAYLKRAKGLPQEARAERFVGNLWTLIPHWGTRSGGEFFRGKWQQGIQMKSERHDKKIAVGHLEKARDLYAKFDGDAKALESLSEEDRKGWHNERVECIFDLASTVSRWGIYENNYVYWHRHWAERDDFLANTAGEEDFDEYNSDWQWRRKRPIGLRLDANGKPIFATAAKKYAGSLQDDQKLLFLLDEARQLDTTDNKRYTGLSWYRQAMLSRARFGMDRLGQYASMYYEGNKYPLQEDLKEINPWELKDGQAVVLAGGQIMVVDLPKEWDVVANLRTVVGDYAKSGVADEAHYSLGLYFQSRQQYTTALETYDQVIKKYADSIWADKDHAKSQIERILARQVLISNSSMQLPGTPIELQISHRNTGKIWFVARKVNHEGFMRELRDDNPDDQRGFRGFYTLGNWHYNFVHGYHPQNWAQVVAAKYIGEEVIRWSDDVKHDGSHRYTHSVLQAPLKDPGAYLIYAYIDEPAKNEAEKKGKDAMVIGNSRAIFGLTDLAIIEKKVKQGNLYMITEARGGAPVAEADIEALEVWNTYDQATRRSVYHKFLHKLKTDKDGLAVIEPRARPQGSQIHAMVKKGDDRFAWTGMSYWSNYHASGLRSGMYAYTITDRPVYRPAQQVKYKVWLRQFNNGLLENRPDRKLNITVFNPRGDKVHEGKLQTDQYGGVDSMLTLADEAMLGVYRIQIQDGDNPRQGIYMGGQTFQVEEYKKPEFEVTVEPGKSHAKLGEKVEAVIKATYYFGGPVSQGTVKYKVFREEYTHNYWASGRWDWLYGQGYGRAYYNYDYLPWWGQMKGGCIAPPWWGGAATPVRELVSQGEEPISGDGTLRVSIDTSNAAKLHSDKDHQYIVQAEVRDASRRTIEGSGAVKVTRQAYYTFITPDKGYYRPGEEMFVTIRSLTPDNRPVPTEGILRVSEVVFGGPNNAQIKETQLHTEKVKLDENGEAKVQFRSEKSGQLKFVFTSPDSWGGQVAGFQMIWVCGRDFTGELHRFNDLEVITDKRTYAPGETAHVMINTRHSNSYVLFADDVDNNHLLSYRVLHLPGKSMVFDIPIKANHAPNFFVEATTVHGTRTHTQVRNMLVPPEKGVIDVSIKTDKSEYKPGEKAIVEVTARTIDGEPAQAQFTLSGFDRSVLYISPETTPQIAQFFHGNVRYHHPLLQTNVVEQYATWGYVHRPFQQLHPYPGAWWGVWGPMVSDWRGISDDEIDSLSGNRQWGSELEKAKDRNGIGGLRQLDQQAGQNRRGNADGLAANESGAAAPPGAPMAARKSASFGDAKGEDKAGGGAGGGDGGGEENVEAQMRTQFADTALWLTTLSTDATGKATASFTMPDNLTTWKLNAWATTKETRVGQASTMAVSTKNLIVRLQAPRFFMEYDEVVLSANVNNYLSQAKQVTVTLDIPKEHLALMANSPREQKVLVQPNGEARVDWRVKVIKEGTATVAIKGLTNEESDAMAMTFPVLVHGMSKQIATTGSMRPDELKKTATIEINIPDERRPELTRLEVQYAPSLVGSMMDALPYLLYYPYESSENTVSRFMPAVLTLKTLQNMGINLEDVRQIRGKLDEIRKIEKDRNTTIYGEHAIFDSAEMSRIIEKGRAKILGMQNGDGGWGWWRGGESSPYFTSYILHALVTAAACDVNVPEDAILRGMQFLINWETQEMQKKHWSVHSQHAFVAYVLSMRNHKVDFKTNDPRGGNLINRLWDGRDKLELYGKSLLCLALANLKDNDRANTALANIKQFLETNDETQVSWFRTPNAGWWYWWNNDIETNAWALKALTKLEPKSDISPRVVKWLLNNRKNGYYWRSTRDTTMVLSAMSDFVVASGEGKPDMTLTFDFDNGKTVKTVKINKDNFFTYDNKFVLEGVALGSGKHTLKITKEGPGALYFNSYLSYFTKEKDIKAAGHELKVERQYFKLDQVKYTVDVEDSTGKTVKEPRLRYERIPLKNGDTVKSGDLIQVELKVISDNNYTYLALEDMKPAGCEPVKVDSGGQRQEGFYSYMEMRDEKVVLFIANVDQGEHLLRYRLRAEVPGIFHALPTKFYAIYVPELKANGNEHVMKIVD